MMGENKKLIIAIARIILVFTIVVILVTDAKILPEQYSGHICFITGVILGYINVIPKNK